MNADDMTTMWAEQQVTALLPEPVDVPEYGTLQWLQLPAGDPRKAAAVITAAELWRRYIDAENLAAWLREGSQSRPPVHEQPSGEELEKRRAHRPPRQLRATPGWPPIAIPGQPGRYLVAQENAA